MPGKKCSTCSRSTVKHGSRDKYICENGVVVSAKGICDRWVHYLSEQDFHKRCAESLKRMEPYQEGTYQITPRVPLQTNYRIIDD